MTAGLSPSKKRGMKRQDTLKKLNICLLLHHDYVSWNGWVRSAFTEMYAHYLSSFGHNITWLLSCRGEVEKHLFGQTRVYPVFYPEGSSLLGRFWGSLLLTYRKIKAIHRLFTTERYDLIQAGDTLLDGIMAIYIKRRYKIPFVFKRDDLTGREWHSASRKYIYLYPIFVVIGWLGNLILQSLIRRADLIISTSQFMAERLIASGAPQEKLLVIRRGVNTARFPFDKESKNIKRRYHLAGCSPIIYVGATSRIRNLDMLLRAFVRVKALNKDARLVIVGSGDKGYLNELALTLGIQEDTIFTGQVPYTDVPSFISVAKVAVCPLPPIDLYRVSSPTKLFEYLVMAKPIVANEEIPEHKEVLEQSGGGILVPYDEESFARAIIELLTNPQKATDMGQKGKKWVEENATYELLARKVEKGYFELLGRLGKAHV
ncbi:glycosyltransferase family 4 protein [Chloroflexota bacterium]